MPKKQKSDKGFSPIRRIIAIQRNLEELSASKHTVKLEVRAEVANRLNKTMTKAATSEVEFNSIMDTLTEEGKKSPMLEAFQTAQNNLWADV